MPRKTYELRRLMYQALFWRGSYLLSTLLLNILFVRYYGAAGSSTVYYLINLYSISLLIGSFSVEGGMGYFLANRQAEPGSLSFFSLVWTVMVSLPSLLLLKGYFHFFDSDIHASLFWLTASTYIPGQLLITFFTALFYARESPAMPNGILLTVNGALILLLGVALAIPSLMSPGVFLYFYFFGVLVQGIGIAILFRIRYGWSSNLPSVSLLTKIFRYSLVAFAANILFFLVYRVDYLFVKRYCTADDLGNYIQVSKLGQALLVIPSILASVIFPRTARVSGEGMPFHLARLTRIMVSLFVIFFLLVLFAGRPVFPLVFGNSFDKMYLPTLVILPGILSLSVLTPLSAYFGGLHRPEVNAKGAFIGLVLIVGGDFFCIPVYGIVGAAAVSSLGYFATMVYSLVEFGKTNRIRPGSMLIVGRGDWRWVKQQAGKIKR